MATKRGVLPPLFAGNGRTRQKQPAPERLHSPRIRRVPYSLYRNAEPSRRYIRDIEGLPREYFVEHTEPDDKR